MKSQRNFLAPAPAWEIAAASVPGRKRNLDDLDGLLGQDRHYFRFLPAGDAIVMAVSDGCGSSIHGAAGAANAVYRFTDAMAEMLERDPDADVNRMARMLRQAALDIADHPPSLAAAKGLEPGDYHTTLLGAAVTRRGIVGIAGIGDGAAVVREDCQWQTALKPQQGRYANETWYITGRAPERRLRARVYRPAAVDRICLFTDGLQNLCLDRTTERPHIPFFTGLEEWWSKGTGTSCQLREQELRGFLNSPRIRERADDDLTLLMAGPA